MATLKPDPANAPAPTKGAPARRRDATATARPAVPKVHGPAPAVVAPAGPVSGPFWFCIHPNRWRVLEGCVVPDPKMLHGSPGANGVGRHADGTPDMRHAFDAQAHQGWSVLDHEINGKGTSYLQQVESTGGWISLWTTVYPGSRNTSHDGKAESAWWLALIADNKIGNCPLYVLTDMLGTHNRLLNRYVDRDRAKDGARMKRLRTAIAAIEAEIAAFAEEAA